MIKGDPYKFVKSQFQDGEIKYYTQMYDIIPVTVGAKDIGIHFRTLKNHLNDLSGLTLKEIERVSTLTDIDPMEVFKMALEEYRKKNKGKKTRLK